MSSKNETIILDKDIDDFCDVIVVFKTCHFRAHQIKLIKASPRVFKNLLLTIKSSSDKALLIFDLTTDITKKYDVSIVKVMMKYIYNSNLIGIDNLIDLLEVAYFATIWDCRQLVAFIDKYINEYNLEIDKKNKFIDVIPNLINILFKQELDLPLTKAKFINRLSKEKYLMEFKLYEIIKLLQPDTTSNLLLYIILVLREIEKNNKSYSVSDTNF